MHCWKDSSGMSLLTAFKTSPLMIPLSLGERKKSRGKSGELGGCSSTVMLVSAKNCQMLSTLRHAKIFVDNLPNTDLFHDLRSFEHAIDDEHHASSTLFPRRWLQSYLLKASCYGSYIYPPPRDPRWNSCTSQKHVCRILCYLHTLAEAFQVLLTEFFQTNFWFIRSSVFIDERQEKDEVWTKDVKH